MFNNQYYYPMGNNQMRPQVDQLYPQYTPTNNLYTQPQQFNQSVLQGKTVESIDVVRAIEGPIDGSISYYPLTDGTAIVSKQLQADGKTKVTIYKPVEPEDAQPEIKYVTAEELEEALKKIEVPSVKEIKEELKNLKRQFRDLSDDLKDKKGD